jgi:hypothetical protein
VSALGGCLYGTVRFIATGERKQMFPQLGATDEIEEPGLYLRYADGSTFEIAIFRCEGCGRSIDAEETFYLHVQPAAPLLMCMHSRCAGHIVELR